MVGMTDKGAVVGVVAVGFRPWAIGFWIGRTGVDV